MLKKISSYILLFLISLTIFLVSAEICVRLYCKIRIIYDMEMCRYATKLKIESPNPLIEHVHRPNSRAVLMGVPVETNADGFRDRDYPVKKDPKTTRILFLGDSLTLGWGVRAEDTFAEILEKKLSESSPTEIINLGIGNYNTTQETHLFLEKGLKYSPDEVVVFYFINDAEPTPAKSRLGFLEHSAAISFFWSRLLGLGHNLGLTGDYRRSYAALYRDDQPAWKATQEAFLLLQKTCREHGIELRVVLLPELHELTHYPFEREYKLVGDFLGQNGIKHLDLTDRFKGEANPRRFWVSADDAHPNALAHRLIAEYTEDFIKPGTK